MDKMLPLICCDEMKSKKNVFRFSSIFPLFSATDEKLLRIVSKKTKSDVWIVSQCQTDSKREIIVKKLQKLFDADVFGKCGDLKCPIDTTRDQHTKCVQKLLVLFVI